MTHAGRFQGRYQKVFFILVIGLIILTLPLLPYWQSLERKGFDLFSFLSAPDNYSLPIVVVGIDEPSFAEFDRQWPWPRAWHAHLIDQLNQAGAAVIVFDVLFAEPSSEQQDTALKNAIRHSTDIVLAADEVIQETIHYQQLMRIDPLDIFLEGKTRTGVAAISLDTDNLVRRFPVHKDAMWRQAFRAYRPDRPEVPVSDEHLVRYLHPVHPFTYVSYYQAMDYEFYLPAETFRDKIVFVGLNLKTSPEANTVQTDTFATPYFSYTRSLTSGVLLQATFTANALQNSMLTQASLFITNLFNSIFLMAAAFLIRHWHPLKSFLLSSLLCLSIAGAGLYLFVVYQYWLPVMACLTGIILLYCCFGGLAFLSERLKKKQIRDAFEHYLSPLLVDEMMKHPENLVLGGHRRELTLMFTDLADFTRISEQLPSEQIEKILNSHLTAMTRIILQHGGTVDKFIGDAIMAFWGAPLTDKQMEYNACIAAFRMQKEMIQMRKQLLQSGGPELRMRVGIHTGSAVVGNMGSNDRFDYTAIGDNVNLASRLEGACKFYQIGTLISGSTAAKAGTGIVLRKVDTVRVKGRQDPVDIYTFCDNEEIRSVSDQAVELYQQQNFSAARTSWEEILALDSSDPLAPIYLKRIAELEHIPPEHQWDSVFTLSQK